MMRACRGREHFTEIDELGLEAFDVEANCAAAGEGEYDYAGRRIDLDKFHGEKIEDRVLAGLVETAAFAGRDPFEAKCRAAAPMFGRFELEIVGFNRIHPVEAIERHDKTVLPRLPQDIPYLDEGILHMRGHDLDIVLVQGDELEFLHERVPFLAFACCKKLGSGQRGRKA